MKNKVITPAQIMAAFASMGGMVQNTTCVIPTKKVVVRPYPSRKATKKNRGR